jgi:hypothetical protein
MHKGYPGGCLKCRRNNSVYNTETGVQSCLHHDVCTPEFLKWEESRFDDLTKRVSKKIPLTKLPPWESVSALRNECCKRCQSLQEEILLKKKTTEAQLQRWILA